MKSYKSPDVIHSVLNTDAFDKRRFREVFEMSPGLKKIRAQSILPTIGPLLGDIWASLYKMKPEIKSDVVAKDLELNKSLIKIIMTNENFEKYRNITRLNDFTSVIATVKIGEMINRWLAHESEKNRCVKGVLDHNFSVKMTEGNKNLQQILGSDSQAFSKAVDQAMQESKQVKNDLLALIGGHRAGSANAELKKVPLRNQLVLAEKLTVDKKTKEIAEWAGRFKQIARKKQKTKYDESVDRSEVTIGNDLDRLLSMEFGLYMHPITRSDFLRRFVEAKTMQYETKRRDVLGKGPFILCLDQSGSMQSLDTQAKGFTLALMSIATKQKRDFCLILFSTRLQILTYKNGKIKSLDLINLAETFLGGGTNFTLPLEAALNVINESRFKNADIVYVTDGEGSITNSFLEVFNKKKLEKGFNVLSLIIGNCSHIVEPFSDQVIKITDFNEEGSYAAFEL